MAILVTDGVRTTIKDHVPEETTWRFTGKLVDETGAAVPAAQLSALTLTIHVDDAAKTQILAPANILNTGRGTVDASGTLTIVFLPSPDGSIQDAALAREVHIATVRWQWAAGAKQAAHEIAFTVRNFAKVP